jgi:hypothetical protein
MPKETPKAAYTINETEIFNVTRDPARARSGHNMTFHYSLNPGVIAEKSPQLVWDVRDLSGWHDQCDERALIRRAMIENKIISVTGEKIETKD